uniref:Hemerythrin n=1 Tax=Fervidicoccus fontis TaxID=683846 RepID=A0A7J3ZJI2_9CREN
MRSSIETLMNEHRVIERALALLELAATRMERGAEVPLEALDMLLKFFQIFADRCHHGKEENELFPLLEARGIPREGGPIGVMLYEHQLGRSYVKAMRESLEVLDKRVEARAEFASNALNYISLLRDHIYKEDNVLYKMALQLLTREDDEKLVREFENIESKIGPGVHEQLVRSLNDVESLLKQS